MICYLLCQLAWGGGKVMYNAHRIYTYDTILKMFSGFELVDFSLVTDECDFLSQAKKEDPDLCSFGCGCFWFKIMEQKA